MKVGGDGAAPFITAAWARGIRPILGAALTMVYWWGITAFKR